MDIDRNPKVGMEFDNLETAWKFWCDYGSKMGFGVRKSYTNKSKKDGTITSCRFVCCKEGLRGKDKRDYMVVKPRCETRTDCKVRIVLRHVNGKLRVHDLEEKHNHVLHLGETTHMLGFKRKFSHLQAHNIVLENEASKHIEDLDQKNEASCLLQYFQENFSANPSFFHAYQMDADKQVTNIFWADARMLHDYVYFGDVVSFDKTCCLNNAHRPLVLFSGFNHHRRVVTFGAALLYDKTSTSIKWLLETFLEAHNRKKPQTIFTDQDQTMAEVLHEVLPETSHGLCTWHLMRDGVRHLGKLMKRGSRFL